MNIHSEAEHPHKNSRGTLGVFVFLGGIALGLFLGNIFSAQAQTILLRQGNVTLNSNLSSSTIGNFSLLLGKLENMSRQINGLYDVCAK